MTGPTFSPDGQWMWDGNGWIPAPPPSNVLPQSSINPQEVSSVANQTGVDPNQLTQAAPYFDQNQDGILQQSELQQAAMAISQSPTAPIPVQTPQQPVMQQPVMQQPVMQQPVMHQPVMHQPVMQQPVMQQPVMQQNTIPMGQAPQQLAVISTDSGGKGKMIALLLVAIVLGGSFYVYWSENFSTGELDDVESRDSDSDGLIDSLDNCHDVYNPDQLDNDGDTIGDECDSDDDDDGILDSYDAFPKDATETEDSDGDGVGDNDDVFPNDANESVDSDNDGVGDNADVYDSGNFILKFEMISANASQDLDYHEGWIVDGVRKWQCESGSVDYIDGDGVDDGFDDCEDGSDEDPVYIAKEAAPEWQFTLWVDSDCDDITTAEFQFTQEAHEVYETYAEQWSLDEQDFASEPAEITVDVSDDISCLTFALWVYDIDGYDGATEIKSNLDYYPDEDSQNGAWTYGLAEFQTIISAHQASTLPGTITASGFDDGGGINDWTPDSFDIEITYRVSLVSG